MNLYRELVILLRLIRIVRLTDVNKFQKKLEAEAAAAAAAGGNDDDSMAVDKNEDDEETAEVVEE